MLLVYGIGYTGALASRELHRQGVSHGVGNRSAGAALEAHAAAVGAEGRAFDLADAAAVERGLAGVTAVLNCAGPFPRTAAPLAAACLERGIHYLDLAGEVAEYEAVRALHERALARGAMLMPGAGFGVVPTEIAAARAAEGRAASVRVRGPEAYVFTARAAAGCARAVLDGRARPGFAVPSQVLGAEGLAAIEGVSVEVEGPEGPA